MREVEVSRGEREAARLLILISSRQGKDPDERLWRLAGAAPHDAKCAVLRED